MQRWLSNSLLIVVLTFSILSTFAATAVQFRRAQATRPEVEIYRAASFDAEVIHHIQPGKFYYISNKNYGPFFKIKVNDKIIGYVADTEIDIEGVGRIEEKPFIDDPDEPSPKSKKNKKVETEEPEEEDEDGSVFKSHYHGIAISLINYHEKTMDQLQVGDLYALGYRYIPFLSDYSSSISWDVNVAWGLPSYYAEKLKVSGQGITAWGGAQILNISIVDTNKTLRYGIGPFLKYANYNIKTIVKDYSLQELNFGILLEGGFIYHTRWISLDFGLRYYWERESYGGLSLGFLF